LIRLSLIGLILIGLTQRNGCGGKGEKAKCENKEPGVHDVLLAVEFPRTRRLYLQADLDFTGRSGTRRSFHVRFFGAVPRGMVAA
jgi:hypothetical protein